MLKKTSTKLRDEYNAISDLYNEEILDLREKLLSAEAKRLSGEKTYTIKEVNKKINDLLEKNIS